MRQQVKRHNLLAHDGIRLVALSEILLAEPDQKRNAALHGEIDLLTAKLLGKSIPATTDLFRKIPIDGVSGTSQNPCNFLRIATESRKFLH
jgi:hypothetical protein